MRHQKWQVGVIALGLGLGVTVNALAQPNPNETVKAANPASVQIGGGRGFGGGNFTPQQRQQMMQQMRTQRLQRTLAGAGVTTKATQDAGITFANTQDQARQSLQEQSRALIAAISTLGTPDTQLATLLTNFQAAVEAKKTRRKTALAALDAKISYSQHPRLEGVLMTLGLVGDEMAVVNDNTGMMGGQGGPGGFGGQGGPGGFDGPSGQVGPGGQGSPPGGFDGQGGDPGGFGGPPGGAGGPPDNGQQANAR